MQISEPVVGFLTSATHDLIARHGPKTIACQNVWKNVLQSVSSSTTLQNDSDLVFAVASGYAYTVLVTLLISGPTAGGFSVDLSVPATSYGCYGIFPDDIGPLTANNMAAGVNNCSKVYATMPAASCVLFFHAVVSNLTAGGNIQLRWAQGTSNGSNTSVMPGSNMMIFARGF